MSEYRRDGRLHPKYLGVVSLTVWARGAFKLVGGCMTARATSESEKLGHIYGNGKY